jgi:HlyD family secretion protein
MNHSDRKGHRNVVLLLGAIALVSCRKQDSDAYGNFEATEVTVAAEVGGRLLLLRVEEGDRVAKGALVGAVDTVPLILERRATAARRAAGASRAREADATIASLEVQQ